MPTRRNVLLAATAIAVLPALAAAQGYPTQTVRIYNPFSAGGTSDILARMVATGLQDALGQPFVVESKPGAGGNIALEAVAKSPPDGHTLAMAPAGMTVATSLFKNMSFNPTRDLAPVVLVGKAPSLLVVPAQSQFRSLDEVTKYARANPGKLNYASFGVGTTPHLFMEMLLSRMGVNMQHVPYKGAGPAVADLIGGQVQLAFQTGAAVLPHVQQGRLRALATSSKERFVGLPAVPTIAEQGVPNFDESAWFGIVAPRNTPAPIISRLNAEMNRILQQPEAKKQLDNLGVVFAPNSAEAFGQFIASEESKWGDIIRKVGIKPE